ncbi:hypothetical protein ACFLTE_05040 [Bacteroidota bacterium]
MILIADSGSYKTDWAIIDGSKSIFFKTKGLNPYFIDYTFLKQELDDHFPKYLNIKDINKVFFYGTGCGNENQKQVMKDLLKMYFINVEIKIDTDLVGAARGILNKNNGIMVILGTGVNAGYYNGKEIIQLKPSLGYILGDEGSGAWMGKELIKNYLHSNLPDGLKIKFESKYTGNESENGRECESKSEIDFRRKLIRELYSHPQPNMYLSKFTDFYLENDNVEFIRNTIENGFNELIEFYIKPHYEKYKYPVSFCGSIAYLLKEVLIPIMKEKDIEINFIKKSSINGLNEFYSIG